MTSSSESRIPTAGAYVLEAELVTWIAETPPEFIYTVIEHPPPNYWVECLAVSLPCTTIHTIFIMIFDICGSVPYHFGAGSLDGRGSHTIPASQMYIGGMLFLLSLVIAAATDRSDRPMRKWVHGVFENNKARDGY
jgi:hypothetical protein